MRRAYILFALPFVVLVSAAMALDVGTIRQMAEGGDLEARYYLGERYFLGDGIHRDYGEAARLFRGCVEKGQGFGGYLLNRRYTDKEPVEVLRPAASQGDAEAQYALGNKYYFGHGVRKNLSEAARWFRRAVRDSGCLEPFRHRERWYHGGSDLEWLENRAGQGDFEAKALLERRRVNAPLIAVEPNPAWGPRGYRWHVPSWEAYDPTYSARFFKHGWDPVFDWRFQERINTPQDLAALRRDAELGDLRAQYHLASRAYLGLDGKRDYAAAAKGFRMVALREAAQIGAERGDTGFGSDSLLTVKRAAESGKPLAQFELANRFYYGDRVAKNLEQAARWYREVAVNGSVLAGFHRYPDLSADPYYQILRKAALQGDKAAEVQLESRFHELHNAGHYRHDPWWNLSRRHWRFSPWKYRDLSALRRAARDQDPDALYLLDRYHEDLSWYPPYQRGFWDDPLFYSRYGRARLDARDLTALRKSAAAGDPDAQYELGARFYFGNGVPADKAEAARWFRLSTRGGSPIARYRLGMMYDTYEDIKALQWSADAGNPAAQGVLGAKYYYGQGVPQNQGEAERLFKLASHNGDALSRFHLGLLSFQQNKPEEARLWLERAARQGHLLAQFNLATLLHQGRGIGKDVSEAIRWYMRAAEKGSGIAQGILAQIYFFGDGLPKNVSEGTKWFRRSGANGLVNPRIDLTILNSEGLSFPEILVMGYAWYSVVSGLHPPGLREDCLLVRKTLSGRLSPQHLAQGEDLVRSIQTQVMSIEP